MVGDNKASGDAGAPPTIQLSGVVLARYSNRQDWARPSAPGLPPAELRQYRTSPDPMKKASNLVQRLAAQGWPGEPQCQVYMR